MEFFTRMHDILNDEFDMNMVIRRNESGLIISVIPKPRKEVKDKIAKPFIIFGDPKTIGNDLVEKLTSAKEDIIRYIDNLVSFRDSLKSTKSPSKSVEKIPSKKERLEGKEDKGHIGLLSDTSKKASAIKNTLETASLASLKSAYKQTATVQRKSVIEGELKILTGKTADKLGISDQLDIFSFKKKRTEEANQPATAPDPNCPFPEPNPEDLIYDDDQKCA